MNHSAARATNIFFWKNKVHLVHHNHNRHTL